MLLSEELQLKSNMVSVLEEMALIEDYFLEEFGVELSETEELLDEGLFDRLKYDVLGVGGAKAYTKNADGKYERKGAAGLVNKLRRKIGGEGSKAGLVKKSDVLNMASKEEEDKLSKMGVKGSELKNRLAARRADEVRRMNAEKGLRDAKSERKQARIAAAAAKKNFKNTLKTTSPKTEEGQNQIKNSGLDYATAKHNYGLSKDSVKGAGKQLQTVRKVTNS